MPMEQFWAVSRGVLGFGSVCAIVGGESDETYFSSAALQLAYASASAKLVQSFILIVCDM